MRALQRAADLTGDVDDAPDLDRAAAEGIAQAVALQVLKDQEEGAVFGAAEVGGDGDVGVLGARHGDGFALKAGHQLRVLRGLGMQHLERHPLAHEHVLRQVNRPHAAGAEHALDSVAAGDERAVGLGDAIFYRLLHRTGVRRSDPGAGLSHDQA